MKDHALEEPPANIVDNFEILYRNSFIKRTQIAESLLIKLNKPLINVRFNEMATGLHVFK